MVRSDTISDIQNKETKLEVLSKYVNQLVAHKHIQDDIGHSIPQFTSKHTENISNKVEAVIREGMKLSNIKFYKA